MAEYRKREYLTAKRAAATLADNKVRGRGRDAGGDGALDDAEDMLAYERMKNLPDPTLKVVAKKKSTSTVRKGVTPKKVAKKYSSAQVEVNSEGNLSSRSKGRNSNAKQTPRKKEDKTKV